MLATTNFEPGLALDSKQFTKCTRLRDRSMDCIPNAVNKAIVSCMHMYKVRYTITGNCDAKTLRTVQKLLFYCSKTGHIQEQFENIFIKV